MSASSHEKKRWILIWIMYVFKRRKPSKQKVCSKRRQKGNKCRCSTRAHYWKVINYFKKSFAREYYVWSLFRKKNLRPACIIIIAWLFVEFLGISAVKNSTIRLGSIICFACQLRMIKQRNHIIKHISLRLISSKSKWGKPIKKGNFFWSDSRGEDKAKDFCIEPTD